ncbi:MAG: hypothetical protein LBU08_00775 [Tannerellaceae bacterium]|jgi:hypothetical protein|nr:hypothetical protein [Tannerellaceae bacterium]
MRRVTSVLLCLLLWFASVQTTVSLHFCGGELHSVAVSTGKGNSCCGGGEKEEPAAMPSTGEGKEEEGKGPCCTEEYVETGTDAFCPDRAPQGLTENQGALAAVALPAGIYGCPLIGTASSVCDYSPPEGARLWGAEWLIYICNFRI